MKQIVNSIFLMHLYVATCFAQTPKRFNVDIELPTSVNSIYIQLYYDDGKKLTRVTPNFKENRLTLSAPYTGRYATIRMAYQDGNPAYKYREFDKFWVTEQPATIRFKPTKEVYPLSERELVNTLEVRDNGEKEFEAYIAKEKKDFQDYYEGNQVKLANNDSLTWRLLDQKTDNVQLKTLEFIKQNGNLYFSFWYFRLGIAGNTITPVDTLIKIYNTVFPENFKNSEEGEQIEQKLKARAIKKNDMAPAFKMVDITGKTIALDNYRGKYVLLTFWATWCRPCVEELPLLVSLRKEFPSTKLEIISVNQDSDSTTFVRGINKYHLNWTHIFGNKTVSNDYGISGIPEVFLIDPTGKILYIRREEKDYKPSLSILSKVMKEHLE